MMDHNTNIILSQRAQKLALRSSETVQQQNQPKWIQFNIAQDHFALPLKFIREVLTLKDLTALPGTPLFIAGIIYHRGEILSVMNLKYQLQLTERGLTEMNKILVLEDGPHKFGVLVDNVAEVFLFNESDMIDKPINLSGFAAEITLGLTTKGIVLLDGTKLIHHTSLVVQR